MSSERLPPREELLQLGGSVASSTAVLAMGFAIGVLWVGTSVQATGCVTQFGATGACKVLPAVEQAARYALFVVIGGFGAAFAVEYTTKSDDERPTGDTQ